MQHVTEELMPEVISSIMFCLVTYLFTKSLLCLFVYTSDLTAVLFVFPTWAAQSRGVTAGSEGGVAGWGLTLGDEGLIS